MTINFLKSRPGLALFGASGMIAAAAFAGSTVISNAAPPANNDKVVQASKAEPAEAPEAAGAEKSSATEVDAPGGPNDQSGAQDGPNDQSGVDGVE
ncbi:MAG: hypothetical protein NVSMB17_06990 [Candidatus Dormibacteria bacterium]